MNIDTMLLRLLLSILFVVVSCMLVLVILVIGSKLRTIKHFIQEEVVLMELTPPPTPQSTLQATEEFFTVLRHILSSRSWRDLVNGRKSSIALEIISTPQGGIRYLIRISKNNQAVFLHSLAAFAPTVTAQIVEDYIPPNEYGYVELLDFRQTGPQSYALKHSYAESSRDPIAYITNAISNLEEGELIALQLVLIPASKVLALPIPAINMSPSAVPTDVVEATLHKGRQPQFQTSFRLYLRTNTRANFEERLKGLKSAIKVFSYEGYQSLAPQRQVTRWNQRYRRFMFQNRLPGQLRRQSCLFASSELAALFHFPYGTADKTEDLRLSQQATLPVPLDIKNQLSDFDIKLGDNLYRGRTTAIGLTTAERERHAYIVGGTGNGKSTLLQYAAVQDMRAGKGIAFIDPHGDLAERLLTYVPNERIDDVVYFNPSDIAYPFGLNLLELPKDLDADQLLLEKDLVTESIVSMFRKIFATNDTSGHRIEYILRNTVQTALTLDDPTLFTVYELLNDAVYRRRVVSTLKNPDLQLFWREFARAGSYQQVSMAAGITAKVGRFLFSAPARRVLEQPTSTIKFDDIMDQGKILICRLSKGQLGEDTAELFGIMILTKLQLAALRRANRLEKERQPFYLYVDEFQNFATPSFAQMLSEARKYKLYLTIAEQSSSQHKDLSLIDIILANVGTIVAFRTHSRHDEQLLQPLMNPSVQKGALSRLPAYNFYIKIAGTVTQPPFSGRTVLLDTPGEPMVASMAIHASRTKYARKSPSPTKESDSKPATEWLPTWRPLTGGST